MLSSLRQLLLPALAVTVLTAVGTAQCLSVGTVDVSNIVVSGTMFDVVNLSADPIVITGFDQAAAFAATSWIDVYTKSGSWTNAQQTPTAWNFVGTDSTWTHGGGSTAQFPIDLAMNVIVPPGATQAFYICTPNTASAQRVAARQGSNQLGTAQATDGTIEIHTGVATGGVFSIVYGLPTSGMVWLGTVHYCKPASNTVIGTGCGAAVNSFYGYYPDAIAAQQALQGNVLRLAPHATGYVGTWENGTAAAAFVPPSGAIPLPVGDDNFVPLTPSTPLPTPYGAQPVLAVSGNGIVAFGPIVDTPGTASWLPASTGFLQSTMGGVYAWHDYNTNEPGSGTVAYHYAGNVLCVTFQDVESYPFGIPNPGTLQFQFDLATGAIAIVFVAIDGNPFGSSHLVGITAPGASTDAGAVDLATTTLTTVSPERGPMTLQALSKPIRIPLWHLRTNGLPASMAFGITVIGLSDPAVNDLAIVGMPGCGLHASLDILTAFAVASGTTSYDWGIVIPWTTPAGLSVYATTIVAPTPATNSFGLITSNAIRGIVSTI